MLYFNAPFDDKKNLPIRITNSGTRRIVWALKCTNLQRLSVDPPAGVLDPRESVSFGQIVAEVLTYAIGNSLQIGRQDYSRMEDAPEDAPKKFNREYFQSDVIIRRKNLQISYNA
ncbi:unnamed protein product [Soboliphyme baturini]|uniref:MSP domain-containing protein n=1 Tax=Soboliphyme baturini TaxID=241478 RepID=A0A183J7X0_9BILA|nr:unnamed protein product [Soboliphyme baturini]